MEINEALLERFLKNQCTDAEADRVVAYLKEHPDELEQYLPTDHWFGDERASLNAEVSDRILRRIRESYTPVKRSRSAGLLIRFAVAASLAGIVVLAGMKFLTGKSAPAAGTTVVVHQNTGTTQVARTVENTTKQVMRLSLSDGSVATIYPNSSLQYLPAFEKGRRDLYLKGKAQFKVAADASRPFTVYAEGIATTVLGTSFLVTAQPDKKVSVFLMEGRVRVWSQHREDSNRGIILKPGDEVAVTGGRFSSYSLVHNNGGNGDNSVAEKKVVRGDGAGEPTNDLVFKNQRLKDVFREIEQRFGVTINDEEAPGIRGKLFTGRFLEKDSLDFIAKTICSFYDLQYRIEGNIVTIKAN